MDLIDIYSLGKEIRLKALELGYRLVIDFTSCKNSISAANVCYWLPNHYYLEESDFIQIPTALIKNENDLKYYEENEYRYRENNIQVKVFTDKHSALEWAILR
jgi:hypothetical protein